MWWGCLHTIFRFQAVLTENVNAVGSRRSSACSGKSPNSIGNTRVSRAGTLGKDGEMLPTLGKSGTDADDVVDVAGGVEFDEHGVWFAVKAERVSWREATSFCRLPMRRSRSSIFSPSRCATLSRS
jgi:hypothetical protein